MPRVMVACMLIYSHVTNRRRRIGRRIFSTNSCYAEFRKSTPYLRQKTRRRVDIKQPLGLDNINNCGQLAWVANISRSVAKRPELFAAAAAKRSARHQTVIRPL
jgi:hypothetical protein